MGQAPIRAAGHVLRHVVGVLLLSWVRALKAAFIAGLAGVLVVEIAAMVMTAHFPPDGTAQLVAGLLGFALAFGAAATVVVDEVLEGMRDLLGMLLGEAEAGARVAATLTEREVGESSASVLRFVGLGGLLGQRPTPAEPVTGDPMALPLAASLAPLAGLAAAASRRETARTSETLADLASGPLAPAPSYGDAGPVRADQLPRLTWTDELPVVRPAPAAPSGDTPNVEPAGGESDAWQASQQSASAAAEEPQAAPADAPNPQGGSEQPVRTGSAEAAGLAEPSQWHAGESAAPGGFTWHDPTLAAEPQDDEESYIQPIDVFGAPQPLAPAREAEPLTRPLPETTRPLLADASAAVPAVSPEVSPDVSPRGSVWDHISQVLAGRPVAPLPDDPESAEGGADDASQGASQPAD